MTRTRAASPYDALVLTTSRLLCSRIEDVLDDIEASVTGPRAALEEIEHLAIDPRAAGMALLDVATVHALSAREVQVLAAATYGVPRNRLATVLGVSENTVKTYVRKALEKLDQRTLYDAVWWIRVQIAPARRLRRGTRDE